MMHKKYLSKGFSLIEVIIYGALLSVFMLIMSDLFVSTLDVKLESDATSVLEQDARFILTRFMYDIPRADQIVLPANIGDVQNQLVLEIGGASYSYGVNGENLELVADLVSGNLNGSETKVSGVSFERVGNTDGKNSIRLNFTLESVTKRRGGVEVRSFQTTIGQR